MSDDVKIPDLPDIGGGWVACPHGASGFQCREWANCCQENHYLCPCSIRYFPHGVPNYCPGVRLEIRRAK